MKKIVFGLIFAFSLFALNSFASVELTVADEPNPSPSPATAQFAVCHSQLDEHFDVFFHVYLLPNKENPQTANINVDVYKDLQFSKSDSARFPESVVKFVNLPDISSIISKDQQLKIFWHRKDETSSFEEIKRLRWLSPLTVGFEGVINVKCTVLPE